MAAKVKTGAKATSAGKGGAAAAPPGSPIEPVRALIGKAYGLRQPVLIAQYRTRRWEQPDWGPIDAMMRELLQMEAGKRDETDWVRSSAWRLLVWAAAAQMGAGLPVFQAGLILGARETGEGMLCDLAAPCAPHRSAQALASLRWAAGWVERLAEGDPTSLLAELRQSLAQLGEELRASGVSGSNSLWFLRAAHDLGLPWDQIAGSTFQFGSGARSRWLESSFTDQSSAIGARLSKDKDMAGLALARIGLPAPPHGLAATPEQAEHIANVLGYPVVVKPADLDGGIGVAANLDSPQKVRRAFLAAAAHSSRIMVQKHVPGQDYRLTVFNGELIWSVLRRPGGVTGNGRDSVAALVEAMNREPGRGTDPRSPLKVLNIDAEALELLAENGMDVNSVPAPGRFVRLRSAANTASGGSVTAVNDQVHPDNRRLAEEVAQAFRLDLVGVDLLIEDIAKSWHETGAHICEVNGRPQLGSTTQQHLYGKILAEMEPPPGRIPIVLIVGAAPAAKIAQAVHAHQSARGVKVGVAGQSGAWIDGKRASNGRPGLFAASQLLLGSRQVDLALVILANDSLMLTGLAVDRFALLVLASDLPAKKGNPLPAMVRLAMHNNVGPTIVNWDAPGCREAAGLIDPSRLQTYPEDPAGMAAAANAIIDGLMAVRPAANPRS